MTPEERAGVIIAQLEICLHSGEQVVPESGLDELQAEIAQALRDERNDALEDAAKVAINCADWYDTVVTIRALKDTPEETK